MATRQCKTCLEDLGVDNFEITTKDGKCRRSVCKPCYKSNKAAKAKEASTTHDPTTIPLPEACATCGKPSHEVTFKWRTDINKGGWRNQCNGCFNNKGYSQVSRAKRRAEDPEGFLLKNAETHLAWAHANPEKIIEQQRKTASDPTRRFKALINYVRIKHPDEDINQHINLDDAESMQSKMSKACHYCNHIPLIGDALNGLDRVDPRGKYDETNTVPCCGACNSFKLTFPTDEFLVGVRNIASFRDDLPDPTVVPRPVALGGTASRREAVKDKTDDLDIDMCIELWSHPCYMCGRAPAMGIDRVDSSRNYTIDNCQGCCTLCNYMKKDCDEVAFLAHIARINMHTGYWLLGDTQSILSTISGPRKPVAAIQDNGTHLIMFPSANTASRLMGLSNTSSVLKAISNKTYLHGYKWDFVDVHMYKQQDLDITTCKAILNSLHKDLIPQHV